MGFLLATGGIWPLFAWTESYRISLERITQSFPGQNLTEFARTESQSWTKSHTVVLNSFHTQHLINLNTACLNTASLKGSTENTGHFVLIRVEVVVVVVKLQTMAQVLYQLGINNGYWLLLSRAI